MSNMVEYIQEKIDLEYKEHDSAHDCSPRVNITQNRVLSSSYLLSVPKFLACVWQRSTVDKVT